ncbi:hypothetical protein C923_00154 [Plasmodium falciparum UGT5.1]|uniref:Erythrocyte membrane protein 1 n=2 Tax=Plasmodium falciparum TaxID=5833 RepID=W7JJR1_PLAFA|nr:hypothetical protein C923_00154 [Plasmodium falciparum UGT5.1]
MGPKVAAGSGGGEDKYKNAQDAKHLFDIIGKDVYEIVEKDAKERSKGELEGSLSLAKVSGGETGSTNDPCDLIKEKRENLIGASGKRHPCANRSKIRFSDENRSQCTYNRIKDSNKDDEKGACAPFRRLSVCDYNLESINTDKIYSGKAKHDLLLEVCMAAKFEGDSLENYRAQYEAKYGHVGFTICTALARSFADIGDIIRGKDLYLGDKKKKQNGKKTETEREKLEQKLKDIFGKIYEGLTSTRGKTNSAEARYGGDPDFFKLREDWWYANRSTVWKAITCDEENKIGDAQYFRGTCGGEKIATLAKVKCRCPSHKVPTYFDYVPQYLRWFEEWAEDFCRKRKKKLTDAITNCRDDKAEKYCSGNGFDCTKTVRAQEIYSMENNCPKCFFACNPFVKWLGNQKLEFLKQKQKYANEINASNQITKQTSNGPINNLYVKDFYDALNEHYPRVDDFLEKLSELGICKDPPTVGNEKASPVDFTKDVNNKIFSRTEYCEPCPICGGNFVDGVFISQGKEEGDCPDLFRSYEPPEGVDPTEINVLQKEKEGRDILEKLKTFCSTDKDKSVIKNDEWKCYHKESNNDKCILQYDEEGKKKKKVKKFYDFFRFWVTHMLNDSIEWREKLGKCLKNGTKILCKNGCNTKCECYESWVQQKESEWGQIKTHFGKQDFGKGAAFGTFPRYYVIETVLEDSFLEDITKAYGDSTAIQGIKNMLAKKKKEREADPSKDKTIIDYLLEHEEEIATECKNCKKPEESRGRPAETLTPEVPSPPDHGEHGEDDLDEDEEEEEDEGEEIEEEEEKEDSSQAAEEKTVEGSATTDTTTPLDVCDTVKNALTSGNLNDACSLKYVTGKNYGWRCIAPSGSKSDATERSRTARSAPESGSNSDKNGATCIPPRRRKLYLGGFKRLTDDTAVSSEATSATSSESPNGDPLLAAFVESAAVETFFLWHKYKVDKEIEKKEKEKENLVGGISDDPDDPQKKLNGGEIPDGFLRQMFYTLGDYRDICIGVKEDVIKALEASGNNTSGNNIKEISQIIEEMLSKQSATTPPTPGTPSDEQRKDWWNTHGPHIWNGMIYALTYDTNSGAKGEPQVDDTVRTKLWDSDKNKPQNGNDYKIVTISSVGPSGEKTTLVDFISRPPYFRYLHEWGQNFCRERKKRLAQIKVDCEVDGSGNRGCSGDGFYCTQKKDRYQTERKSTKSDNGFCGTQGTCDTAAKFLENLGPCKNNNENENGKDILDFTNPDKTFVPATNCDPCSQFTVDCKNCNSSGGGTKVECKNKTITEEDIKTMNDHNHVVMGVIDNNPNGFDGGLETCKDAHIFKGIRKDEWKCGKVCGLDVCGLKKDNNNIDEKQIILKKTKSTIDLLRVINIPKSDYDIPTKLSPNRYIPYTSGKYRGKRYIYLEGDSGTDSGYTDHYSDITSSSESEYEELDINDIYVPGSPKYKTLIEVVLEPSGNNTTASGKNTPASDTQNDIQNDGIPSSKITDNEWNTLKHEFISQYLQSEQPKDVPNDYTSGNSSTNTNITTMSRHNVDNNTHPTTSRHNVEEKPFITSIHDRDLYTGEEYSYNVNMVNNDIPMSGNNDVYSGIDLINDSLSGDYDIYDEILKRKENELFGTNHVKQTSIHSVAKPISDDPIHNQLELFHTWLDRHRDMCEKWENHHERLPKLKEEWENETHSGNTHPSDSNKTLNTDRNTYKNI